MVECFFIDAWNKRHDFLEKIPVVTQENLDKDTKYPINGEITCKIIKFWQDVDDRELVSIDTSIPFGIESNEGITQFDLLKTQLIQI